MVPYCLSDRLVLLAKINTSVGSILVKLPLIIVYYSIVVPYCLSDRLVVTVLLAAPVPRAYIGPTTGQGRVSCVPIYIVSKPTPKYP